MESVAWHVKAFLCSRFWVGMIDESNVLSDRHCFYSGFL